MSHFVTYNFIGWYVKIHYSGIHLVGALSWSIFVLVLLAGKGVGAFDARYGVAEGIVGENAEKYSAANCTTSSGFRRSKNCRKSASKFFSSGWDRMYVPWSAFSSSWIKIMVKMSITEYLVQGYIATKYCKCGNVSIGLFLCFSRFCLLRKNYPHLKIRPICLYECKRIRIVKITPTWNVLPTFSRNLTKQPHLQ